MQIYTHYCVQIMRGGGLDQGMYTSSAAYATPELARGLGPMDPRLPPGRPIALTQVETCDDGEGGRRLVRTVILEQLSGVSGERPAAE